MSQAMIVELEELLEKVSAFYHPESLQLWITSVDKDGNRHRNYSKSDECESNKICDFTADWFCKERNHYIKRTKDGMTVLGKAFDYDTKHKDLYFYIENQIKKLKSD